MDEEDQYFSDIEDINSEISNIDSELSGIEIESDKEKDEDEEDKRGKYESKEQELVSEWNVFDRVGGSRLNFTDEFMSTYKNIKDKDKGRLYLKSQLTSEQLFLVDLQKSLNKYQIDISNNDIEMIKKIIHKINHIQYKNANAFLLGYYILKTKGDKIKKININSERFNEVKVLISSDKDIFPEDVLRYSSLLWEYI